MNRPTKMPPLEVLQETEWSPEFERLMRNRLIMGAFRYGRLRALKKPTWDRLGAIRKKVVAFEEGGNLELLVDIANLALLEFVEGRHPKRHFAASDDGERVKKEE